MFLLWIKSFHIIAVVCWFAGLLYLPRLFVYHSMSTDQASLDRFKIMERKLFRGIMTPAMVITLALGIWMISLHPKVYFSGAGWMHVKLLLVLALVIYHFYCGKIIRAFRDDNNHRTHVFYRWFNEVPVIFLIPIVILVVVKPF